ncbi:MAG: 4Fe-4S binding protein [Bacillota bacterium]|nr:4Fe-4S binding protein [Bacillota bacterium]
MKRKRLLLASIIIGVLFLIIGIFNGDLKLITKTATYGNFDVPGTQSWVMKLRPGIDDYASKVVYGKLNYGPLKAIISLFIFMLLISIIRNKRDIIWRKLSQWTFFVIARLGVLRVSGICPVKRTQLTSFPFLNCQACEMATGGCPIGMIQWSLINKRFPFYVLGIVMLFGTLLGRAICGWMCPFGFFVDALDRFIYIRKLKSIIKPWKQLNFVKYAVLIFIFTSFLWVAPIFCIYICQSANIYGLLPYYLTTGLEGYKQMLFSSGWIHTIFFFHMISMFILILGIILLGGRWFCRYLCPLGAVYGLFNYVSPIAVTHDKDKCTHCNKCIKQCPMNVDLERGSFLDVTGCIKCGKCIKACNVNARQLVILGLGENTIMLKNKIIQFVLRFKTMNVKKTAKYAKKNTDFYQKYYKNYDTNNFSGLPLLTKYDLIGVSPYELLNKKFQKEVVHYGETSGSSGAPTPAFFTKNEILSLVSFVSAFSPYSNILKNTAKENRTAVNVLTFGYTIAGFSFGTLLQKFGFMVAQLGSRSTIALPERNAKTIIKLTPSTICSTPLDFMSFMEIIRLDFPEKYTKVKNNLKILLSTAEPCSVSRQKQIEKHFGIHHINTYASVDGFASIACPCGEKHILDKLHHIELYDKDMNYIGSKGTGRLSYTTLMKKSTPMVKYLLDDLVTIHDSNCPYGYKKSIKPHGRYELSIDMNNKIWGNLDFEEIIYSFGLFMDYSLTIEESEINLTLEEYPSAKDDYNIFGLKKRLEDDTNLKCNIKLVSFGKLTEFRKVREAKSIVKVIDNRESSRQSIPDIL